MKYNIADYPEIRGRSVALHSRIMKKMSNDDLKTCGRHLGLLRNKVLVMRNENEVAMFSDYAIYAYRPNGINMADKYLRLSGNRLDVHDLSLLEHMRLAHYAIYQVEDSNGLDTTTITDVFSKAAYKLLDYQLAKSVYQGLMLACHLVDFEAFSIQTGGAVIVTREIIESNEVAPIIDRIEDNQVSGFLGNPVNAAKLAKAILSATIRLSQSSNVEYREV